MNPGIIDIIFLIPFVIYAVIGFRKGAIIEIIGFIGLIVALIFCLKFSHALLEKSGIKAEQWWVPYAAYIVVFIVVYFVFQWIGKLLEKIIKVAQLSLLNNLLGALIGGFKVVLIASLLLWISDQTDILPDKFKAESKTYKYIKPVAPYTIQGVASVLPAFKNIITDVETYFDGMKKEKEAIYPEA